jgi:hypothetical protein
MRKLTTALRAPAFATPILFALLFVASPALAEPPMKTRIPFDFVVGGKTLPAGAYEFLADGNDPRVVVHGVNGEEASEVVITTLALPPHSMTDHAHLVFDQVGTIYTLSEVWKPGTDGILVYATVGKHAHHVLHLKP